MAGPMHLLLHAAEWIAGTTTPTSPGASPTAGTAPKPGHGSGDSLGTMLSTGLAGLGAGAAAVWYGVRDRPGRSDAPAAAARQAADAWERGGRDRAGGGSGVGSSTTEQPAADREQLIRGLIDLADRLRDADRTGLWKTANRHLEAVGVQVHVADGQRFDPAAHQAGGYQPTDIPGNHLTVAATEECGYTDHGRVIRRPRVIVYRVPGDGRVG
jgi:hypothetical protein